MKNKKMHKGVATRYLVFMILGIIVFAFGIYLAIFYAPGLVDAAMRFLVYGLEIPGENGEGDKFAVALMEAIKCAYYRCTEGCDSTKVQEMSTEYYVTLHDLNCSEYCKGTWDKNSDGKICDDEAKKHPVDVLIEEGAWITKEWVNQEFGILEQIYATKIYNLECLVCRDDCGVQSASLTIQDCSECEGVLCYNKEGACKKCKVGPDIYYIWTELDGSPGGYRSPVVCTQNPGISCTDTDGGDNKLVKGTCTDSFGCAGGCTDSCVNPADPTMGISEFMCNPEGTSCEGLVDLNCPPEAPVCVDGACTTTTTTTSPPESCDELGGNCIARGICDIEPDLGCISSSDCTGPNCCCVPIIIVP